MLYQSPTSNSRYTITFDTFREQFDTTFPIVLQGKLHPQNYAETVERASAILKEHMKHIESPSSARNVLIFLGVFFFSLFLIVGAPMLIYFLAYANDPENGWWVWATFPPLYIFCIIGLIVWSVRRRRNIVQRHIVCKTELQNFFSLENQKFAGNGIQFVLRYEPVIIMGSRYTYVSTYKHLAQIPTIEIYVAGLEQAGYIMPQQQPVMMQGYQSVPTEQYYQPQVYTQQEPVHVYEQPTQPLLGNQKV